MTKLYAIGATALVLCFCVLSVSAQVPVQGSPFWESVEQDVYSTGMIWRDMNLDGFIDVVYSNGNDMALADMVLDHRGDIMIAGYLSSCDS